MKTLLFLSMVFTWWYPKHQLLFYEIVAYPVQRTRDVVHWRSGSVNQQYRIQQHKSTQQHLIWTPTRLNYCMHAVRTQRENYNVQDQKKGQRLITKEAKLKGKRKLNTISWNLRLILSKGQEKLQRYVTPKKIKLLWKLRCCSVDLLTPTPQKLKERLW